MSQVKRTDHFTPTRNASASLGNRHPTANPVLSDREAVIAVMVANGASCETIATRLCLPVRTIESYLRQALQVLEITDAADLTYVAVAAHYNGRPAATATQP